MTTPMFTGSSWDFQLLDRIDKECREIAVTELGLKFYEPQIELCTSDQMLDIYANAFPISYNHWSSGKAYARAKHDYNQEHGGLAYEVVFNTDPCVAYFMEDNTATMQALVCAHALYGHNSFFAMNELFLQHTDAKNIMNYMIYARDFVNECESKYGIEAVENILDSCHALKFYSVDKYKRPQPLSKELQKAKERKDAELKNQQVDALWDNILPSVVDHDTKAAEEFEAEENILFYIEMNAPNLKPWQREMIRMVRKIAQYFYPQMQTQVCNEGHASFTHYYIMTRLMEKGLITDSSYLEFLHSHTNVVNQYPNQPRYNPYYLGFNILMENKRICQEPTKEDELYFPDMVGTDWLKQHHFAISNFRDESFINQYLSPAMVRRERMFKVIDDTQDPMYSIAKIQNERGFEDIRSTLASQYELSNTFADIQVVDAKLTGNRTLYLQHTMHNRIKLDRKSAEATLAHVRNLWGYPVVLTSSEISTSGVRHVSSEYYSE